MNKQAENFLKKLKSSVKSNFESNLGKYGDIDTLIEQFVGALTNDELLAIYRGNPYYLRSAERMTWKELRQDLIGYLKDDSPVINKLDFHSFFPSSAAMVHEDAQIQPPQRSITTPWS